jgi:hypothetical protein
VSRTALILGDQLSHDNPALEGADRVLLVESRATLARATHHRQRDGRQLPAVVRPRRRGDRLRAPHPAPDGAREPDAAARRPAVGGRRVVPHDAALAAHRERAAAFRATLDR